MERVPTLAHSSVRQVNARWCRYHSLVGSFRVTYKWLSVLACWKIQSKKANLVKGQLLAMLRLQLSIWQLMFRHC